MTTSKKPFPDAVHDIVRQIPKGTVMTYKEVALEAGYPGAHRAVGTLMSKNRSKDIPCHRVIRSDGIPGGYAWDPARKIEILKSEGIEIDENGKVI